VIRAALRCAANQTCRIDADAKKKSPVDRDLTLIDGHHINPPERRSTRSALDL
jgi:hypothetical protein